MKGFFKKLFKWIFKAIIFFMALSVFSVIVFRWVPVPFTPLMIIRNVEQWSKGEKAPFKHDWVPLDKISPNLGKAVIVSEDQKFMEVRREELLDVIHEELVADQFEREQQDHVAVGIDERSDQAKAGNKEQMSRLPPRVFAVITIACNAG